MMGWGRMSRPSPPGSAPQPATSEGIYAAVQGSPPPAAAPLMQRLPAAEQTIRAPFVSRVPNRSGIVYHYSYGATAMPRTVPYPGGADGQVWRSRYQPYVRRLFAWAPSTRFMRSVFPANYGITFRSPAPRTQTTGGPGPGRMGGKPIFGRVQRIPRAMRRVPAYETHAMNTANRPGPY